MVARARAGEELSPSAFFRSPGLRAVQVLCAFVRTRATQISVLNASCLMLAKLTGQRVYVYTMYVLGHAPRKGESTASDAIASARDSDAR